MSVTAINIVTNILRVITILLHIVGTHLLTVIYNNGTQTAEQLFLINLSLSEIVFNFFDILSTPIGSVFSLSANTTAEVQKVQDYIVVGSGYGVVPVYFLSMIYLTLDRLLEIVLCIKYHLYCNVKIASRILISTWIICVAVGIILALVHGLYPLSSKLELIDTMVKYLYPVFEIVFIILAFVTYGFLFHKYRKSRIPPAQVAGAQPQRQPTVLEVFQSSRFHVPVCLIASFLFFITVADLMYSFGIATNYNKSEVVNDVCRILIVLGCFTDAVIYIFLNPTVKNLLLKKLRHHKIKRSNRVNPSAARSTFSEA